MRPLNGKPLIAHSIEQAKAAGIFEYVAVDSDLDEILETAIAYGADMAIRRPPELATDVAAKVPAIRHCVIEVERLTGIEFDTLVDLDVTSPLREVEDIKAAVAQFEASNSQNLITAMPSRRSPYFNMVEVDDKGRVSLAKQLATTVVRRQDAPKCFDMNASIYVWKRSALFQQNSVICDDTILYVMPEERSIDIDSELDFMFVEFLIKDRGRLVR